MKLRTLADINREIRLRSLVNLFWFCAVALPVLPQAPPSQDAFVRRTTPAINNRVGKTMIVSPGVTRQIPFKRPASVQQRTLNASTSVASLYSDASSIFLEALTFPAGNLNRANAVTSADVNGDGRADLIVANQCLDLTCTAGGIALLLGNGDGSFQPPQSYDSGGFNPFSVAVADMNGDGHPDLVVANGCANSTCQTDGTVKGSVAVLLGNGNGTFQAAQAFDSGGLGARSVVVADVNGDGYSDAIVSNTCGNGCLGGGTIGVLFGNGNGTLQLAQTYGSGPFYISSTIAIRPVNGDTYPH